MVSHMFASIIALCYMLNSLLFRHAQYYQRMRDCVRNHVSYPCLIVCHFVLAENYVAPAEDRPLLNPGKINQSM